MLDFISSFFSFYIWIAIATIPFSFLVEVSLSGGRIQVPKSGTEIFCIILLLFSTMCAIQRYTTAKSLAYPMSFFDSYEDIRSCEDFSYKIIVYDKKDSKQIRVSDKENDLIFDFVVKNDNDATTECVDGLFNH